MNSSDTAGYMPTMHLRWTECRSGEEKPRASIPGYPECGPSYFKLQQLWVSASEGDPIMWVDVEEV